MIHKLLLTIRELYSSRFVSLVVFCAVFVTVVAGSFFEILNISANRYIGERFAASIPPDTIRVTGKPPASTFFFRPARGKPGVMDDRMLRALRKMEGVSRVDPVMSLGVPMQARLSFLGFSYRTDLVVIGLPYRMVSRDIQGAKRKRLWNSDGTSSPVPVLVPETVLSAYNNGIAQQNSLPALSGNTIVGMRFKLLVGRSSLLSLDDYIQVDAEVSGFTNAVKDLALIVPLNIARYYNRRFKREGKTVRYSSAYLKVRDHASLLDVSSRLSKKGLRVETGKILSREILKLKRNISIVSRTLLYIILFLSAAAVAFSTLIATQGRLEYYRILRMLGASRLFITTAIVVKYALIGCAASGAGILAVHHLSGLAGELVPVFSPVFPARLHADIFLWGTLIPVFSTIPGLIRLHVRELDRD